MPTQPGRLLIFPGQSFLGLIIFRIGRLPFRNARAHGEMVRRVQSAGIVDMERMFFSYFSKEFLDLFQNGIKNVRKKRKKNYFRRQQTIAQSTATAVCRRLRMTRRVKSH